MRISRRTGSKYVFSVSSGICRQAERDRTVEIRKTMLMFGKEASNRKQEIDHQHHTIPNQRLKNKHCGNAHNRLWNHG